jgi:hydroxyacyl-ACP dehydratase HTD2-like protein with hotdog domain
MQREAVVVGRSGTPFQMPIEHGKVREFVAAVEDKSVAPGDPHAVIPPTFLASAVWWEQDGSNPLQAAGLDSSRMLHVEQEFVFHGPPPSIGSILTGQSRIADVFEKQGKRSGNMTFVSVVTEFRDSEGHLVAEGTWTEAEIARPATHSEGS